MSAVMVKFTLRRRDGQWGVVLPTNFAHKAR